MRLARIILAFALLAAILSIILTTKSKAMETEEITNRLALGMDVSSLKRSGYRPAERIKRRRACCRR